MNQETFKPFIAEIVDAFERQVKELPIIPSRNREDSDYFLSRLLLSAACRGNQFPRTALKATALALEYLGQAVKLGERLRAGRSFCDEILLTTDYFYAEAINQVASLGDVEVIAILASAIEETAAARTTTTAEIGRDYLIGAAVKLGFHLSQADNRYGELADKLGRGLPEMSNKEVFDVVKNWRI